MPNPNGTIVRDGSNHVVRVQGDHAYLLEIPGVVCENPDASEDSRIYSKTFRRKRIYLADKVDQARKEILGGNGAFIIGMTGYSSIKPEQCLDWGLEVGAYEEACADILTTVIRGLQSEYQGIRVKLVHGASNMGIDASVMRVARNLNLDHLGHNCPKWMFYVEDNDEPVYVAANQESYSREFIISLMLLLSAGGRMQALEHDIAAAIRHDKRLVLLNVVQAIAKRPPLGRNANGDIGDATTAFQDSVIQLEGIGPRLNYRQIRDLTVEAAIDKSSYYLPSSVRFHKS